MNSDKEKSETQKQPTLELAKSVLEVEAQAVLALRSRLNESFLNAVELIKNCRGKLVISGIGKSGQIARKLSSTFSSTGTPSVYLHPADSSHGDLGLISDGDVVMMISYGGNSPELSDLILFTSRKGVPLIAMTGNLTSQMAKAAACTLDISVTREACPLELAPTASSTASLALGDALAMAVMSEKGFQAEDFAKFHPGGSLGFRLSKVKDIMHKGAGFIKVSPDQSIRQVVSMMSRAETRGAAAVVDANDHLIGIITDGDIRRRMESSEDPLKGTASDIMNRSPRTIDDEELAEKALFMMEQFRINVLMVIESSDSKKVPVGVLHIQDLLRGKIR